MWNVAKYFNRFTTKDVCGYVENLISWALTATKQKVFAVPYFVGLYMDSLSAFYCIECFGGVRVFAFGYCWFEGYASSGVCFLTQNYFLAKLR